MIMRRLVLPALLAASAAMAQNAGARVGPQFYSYKLGAPSNVTIAETAVPFFVFMPMGGMTLDIGSAYAMANVQSTVGGQTRESKISGLTDTQIRATMPLGTDMVLLTMGVNVPTGKSTADTSEQMAAALIGNDFLVLPISSMGSGFGGTGGVALATPVGQWNLGAGVSVRTGMPFDPYEDGSGNKLRYTPGTETRMRVGIDHPYGSGRAALGFTYSKFSDDKFQSSVYNTGDRMFVQGYLGNSLWAGDYMLSVWNMLRSSGTLADGSATGAERITDVSAAYGIGFAGGRVEPGISFRTWAQAENPTSYQSTFSLRYELGSGRMAFSPMAGYTIGSMGATTTESASLTGFRVQVALRLQ